MRVTRDTSEYPNFINDIIEIEKSVYPMEYVGSEESIMGRYIRNKDTFMLLVENNKVVGYLCLLPITDELHNKIIVSEDVIDDDIEPKDVLFKYKSNCSLYLISVAISTKYQNGVGVKMLHDTFVRYVNELNSLIGIKDVLATAISEDGYRFLKRLNFKLVKEYNVDHRVMRLDFNHE